MSFIRYGKRWKDSVTDVTIELWAYRQNWTLDLGGLGQPMHMARAIRRLWPENMANGERGYIWHDWSDRRVLSWCAAGIRNYQIWWGPSSCGKSTDAAVFALTHWLAAPNKTTVIVCSTTKDMLEKRIWGEIIRFHSLYQDKLPGTYFKSKHAILYGDENSKNGIFGIAIQKGSIKEALGNLIGIHNDFVVLIIDEMQSTREAAIDAADNLSAGCREFKLLGMGNPENRLDPLGRYSEPVNGWDSITPKHKSWKTRFGECHFFNGEESPGVTNPKKYYFMLNKDQIDALARKVGRNSPRFWSQRIGFIPPEGLNETVFTESMLVRFGMQLRAEWVGSYRTIFGVDPAWSSGGNRAVIVPARVGEFTDITGQHVITGIEFQPEVEIHFEIMKEGELLTYFMYEKIRKLVESLGGRPSDIAIDITATQRGLADVIEREWGRGVHRVNFAGAASDLRVSDKDRRKGHEVYENRVSELWFTLREYGEHEQLRGISIDAAKEITARNVQNQNMRRLSIESKKDMIGRTSYSPDIGDAYVCVVDYARNVLHMLPGNAQAVGREDPFAKVAKKMNVDGDAKNYLVSAL